MSIAEIRVLEDGIFVECQHCLVNSIKLSTEDLYAIHSGQQMIEVCQVCGEDVIIGD